MTQPTDKVRADFEAWLSTLPRRPHTPAAYDWCLATWQVSRTAALNEQSAEIERLKGEQGEAQPETMVVGINAEKSYAISRGLPAGTVLYTHPPAPKLVTVDDVTDAMVFAYTSAANHERISFHDEIAAAVNAYNGLTLEASK